MTAMGMIRRAALVVGIAGTLCVAAGAARADVVPGPSTDVHVTFAPPSYAPFDKLGRGVINLLGGWLEIPSQMEAGYRRHPENAGAGMVGGLGVGVFTGVRRTIVGAFETVTFFLPIPRNYAPILPPLDYFKADQGLQPPQR